MEWSNVYQLPLWTRILSTLCLSLSLHANRAYACSAASCDAMLCWARSIPRQLETPHKTHLDLGITKSKILRDSDITEYDQDRERMWEKCWLGGWFPTSFFFIIFDVAFIKWNAQYHLIHCIFFLYYTRVHCNHSQ